jgi:hypothetical protein
MPLLQNVRDQMTLIKQEEAECHKQKVLKLTGVWSAEVRATLAGERDAWPPLVPRVCRLYLGTARPHWPYRLEWLGPASPGGEDSLLIQIEFLNPHCRLAGEQPPAGYRRRFTFNPGKAKVLDRTQEVIDSVVFQIRNQTKAPAKGTDLPGAGGAQPQPAEAQQQR